MTQFVCISLDCREKPQGPFESLEAKPTCPYCGYSNAIRRVAVVHLLVRDIKGPIRGDGANYRVACGKTPREVANATGDPNVTNCPACLATCEKPTPTPAGETKTA